MSRRSEGDLFTKIWIGVLVAVAGGCIIWDVVPHRIIYTVGGLVGAGLVAWLVLKIRRAGRLDFSGLKGSDSGPSDRRANVGAYSQPPTLPRLSSADQARLRRAIGDRCENPFCKQPEHRGLQIHHIIPRRNPRSTNRLDNLLVLCPNCHHEANHGLPGTAMQPEWARDRGRFVQYDRVRDWDEVH